MLIEIIIIFGFVLSTLIRDIDFYIFYCRDSISDFLRETVRKNKYLGKSIRLPTLTKDTRRLTSIFRRISRISFMLYL